MIPLRSDLALDRKIVTTALPNVINLAAVPVVNAVDTFWVGRMGIALALAGQAAANQAFFTIFFLVNYLPTITAPLVASAVGSWDIENAKKRVCESLFLSGLLGLIGTIMLVCFPMKSGLSLILPDSSQAVSYAVPYLRVRALSLVPALVGATGFAAFRGMLDTVTPLKVSLLTKYVSNHQKYLFCPPLK
jgi:Na+-driven multidrug efflux pump